MDSRKIVDELKAILVARLKFDEARAAAIADEAPLARGVDGAVGLDSLDFIELSLAIEERFGIAVDDTQDLAEHFASLDTLSRFIEQEAERA
jgi:acyl carrier protein